MRRINVVGTSCSGKTMLAHALAERLGRPHVELDALFWGPDWQPVPDDVFRDRVREALDGDAWVADGGYRVARDITWARADTVVWLDYVLPRVLLHWARRTARRIATGEEIWPGSGNRETIRRAFAGDGLLWWILTTHRGRRARFAAELAARPDLAVVRLASPAATRRWLACVQPERSPSTTTGAMASAQNP